MTPPPSEASAWKLGLDDQTAQAYVRMSAGVSAKIERLRSVTLSNDLTELTQQATALQDILPHTASLTTWTLDQLVDARSTQELVSRYRRERDEHMNGESRLQQKLADAEIIMKRLASSPAESSPRDRAEKIADPDKFDGTREKLKAFKDQLLLKTSGNPARFPNVQHKLRYAFQFLTGKAQRTMRIHLKRSTDTDGEETYEILFTTFAEFLTALDRHFGDPDEKHTAAMALDKLRQNNREFGAYYADFQELMDTLDHTDDTSRRHALTRGLSHEMQKALAISPAPTTEGFDQYVKRLNELDCRLRALQSRTHQQPRGPVHTPTPGPTTATGTDAGPMDLSATKGRISKAEKARRRAQGLCMYCGGTGHFAAQCPARPAASKAAGTPGGRRAITAAGATVAASPAPVTTGHVSEVDSDSEDESGKGGAQL